MSLRTTPAAVIGAGPAGVSAALWFRSLNLSFEWFADEQVGGMLHRIYNALDNYPGRRTSDGEAMAGSFRDHVDDLDIAPTRRRIASVSRSDEHWILDSDGPDDEPAARSRAVVVATGTAYRQLGIPGEPEGLGDYVSQSAARDASEYANRTVAMVGGGDSGFEGALRLSDENCHVHLLLRSEPKAREDFRERVRGDSNIMVHPIPTVVDQVEPLPGARGARLQLTTQGNQRTLEVACLFVRIGVTPTAPVIDPAPDTDDANYIRVDTDQRTNKKHLYAAGDVTTTSLPAIATAVGDGARAAHTAAIELGHKAGHVGHGL